MENVVKRLEEKKEGEREVFKWFRTHVIDSKQEPSIEHQELVSVQISFHLISYLFLTLLVCFPLVRDISKSSQT